MSLVAPDGSDGAKRTVEAAARAAGKLDLYLRIIRVVGGWSEDVAQYTATERSPDGGCRQWDLDGTKVIGRVPAAPAPSI